ncbi:PREDICTED: polymeric immunoglobulin receptor-like [Chaetura pelagica]|uniref:polymeric immunoglobulin receptor-like n=1 Tax=Chaetura pelagica TaxID=8897 RepID=UPI000523DC51|nr:PREDICTED: polymeric immunoglobulin receptor-like [Chaetura pelagica]
MTLLALVFLLAFFPAQPASSRYLPKAASNPVFGPRQVYGLLGGSAIVKCFYPPTSVNRHDRKYWCRQSATGCRTIVSTSGYVAPGYQDRISILDHPDAESFQINITQLTAADTGTYQCGVGINGRGLSHKVNLEVSEGPHLPEGAELYYVKLHSTLTVSCSFGKDAELQRKYLCKMGKKGCYDIVDNGKEVDKDFEGRVLLSLQEDPGSFSVVITQMGWEDSGLYLCGFGTYGVSGETKELDVHVYEETSVPQGKPTVLGVKGSSATFECHYNPLKRSSTKYWCRWKPNRCEWIISDDGYVAPFYEGRVAMYDSPDNSSFTIILNQLESKDEGYYWCMTDDVKEQQSSTQLKIIDGEPGLTGEKEVEARVGSRVDLACHYPCKYYSYEKYWCKWDSPSCTPMPASDQRQPGPGVTCDTDNRTVILSFDAVAESDQGWYWCGVKHNGHYGETMAVQLQVTGGSDADHSLDLLDVDKPSQAEPPSHAEPGVIPKGRAFSDVGEQSAASSESSGESRGPNTIALVVGPVGAVLLVLATAFAVFKYRQLKRSDLVSVGSYRTNISMSDFESVKEYGASNSACVKESQETQLGGDELITTGATPENTAETKKAKRSSKEDVDLAYSAFLLTSGNIVQDTPGGDNRDSATPDVPPPGWTGQI